MPMVSRMPRCRNSPTRNRIKPRTIIFTPSRRGTDLHGSGTPPRWIPKHGSPAAAPTRADVVGDDVATEVVDVGGEDPAAVAAGGPVGEPAQAPGLAHQEKSEHGAQPGHPVDLLHRRGDP